MRKLPISEAARLAVYFEESGAYQYRKRREIEAESHTPTRNERVETVSIGDDEEDE